MGFIKLKRFRFLLSNVLTLLAFYCNALESESSENPFSHLGNTVPDYVNKHYDQTGRLIGFPDWQEVASSKTTDPEKIKKLSEYTKERNVIFSYPYTHIPDFNYCPSVENIIKNISVALAPSEYEPLTFGIFGLQNDEVIEWDISDFRSRNGNTLDKKLIDVRVLHGVPNATVTWNEWEGKKTRKESEQTYKRVPLILEKEKSFMLTKHEARHFWLTVYIPEGTASGAYSGHLTLKSTGWNYELPIEINVLPIELKTPDTVFNIFLQPDKRAQGFYFKENLPKHLADIKAHGINSIDCDLAPEFIYDAKGNAVDVNISGITKDNGVSPYDNLIEFMELYKKQGFKGPLINCFRCFMGYQQYPLTRKGTKVNIFDESNIKLMMKFLDQLTKAANEKGIKIGLEIGDEPANTDIETRKVKTFIPLIRKNFKDIMIVTFINGMWQGLNEIEKFSDNPPNVYISNCVNEELLASAKKHSNDLWIYSNIVEPVKARYLSGFFPWAIGTKGVSTWVYQTDFSYNKNTYLNFDGFNGRPFSQSVAAPSANGPLPMAKWETYREGIDDQRYIYTLECLISRILKESKDKSLLDAAGKASRMLDLIRKDCIANPVTSVSINWLTPLRFQNYRKAIVSMIINLQDMLNGKKPLEASLENSQGFNIIVSNINVKNDNLSEIPVASEKKIVYVPEISGEITEDDWKNAAVISDFKTIRDGKSPSEVTQTKILFNQERLFVRFECNDTSPEKIIPGSDRKKDQEVWRDDHIEIYLGEGTKKDSFKGVHFLLNAGNASQDSLVDTSKYKFEKTDWDTDWVYSTSVKKNGWIAELRIPLLALELENKKSRVLKFLVGRYLHRNKENSSYPATDHQFFEPEKMGLLVIAPSKSLALLNEKVYASAGTDKIRIELFNSMDREFIGKVYSSESKFSKIKLAPDSSETISLDISPLNEGTTDVPVKIADENGKVIMDTQVSSVVEPEIKEIEMDSNIIFPGNMVSIDVKNTICRFDDIKFRIRILKGEDVISENFFKPDGKYVSLKVTPSLLPFEEYVMDVSVDRDGTTVYRKSLPFVFGI